MVNIFIFLTILSITVNAIYHRCPPEENTNPCKCNKIDNQIKVSCNAVKFKEIRNILPQLEDYDVDELRISNSYAIELSKNLFRSLNIRNLIVYRSQIVNFEFFKVFTGLQQTFRGIRITNCTIQKIHFSAGNFNHRMTFLIFEHTKISDYVTTNMTSLFPKSLKKITLQGGILEIEGRSFFRFSLITELDLSFNKISVIGRTMFPKPCKHLQNLNLAHNNIFELPEDIFVEMPRLEFLNLSYNKMKQLSSIAFNYIWNQLHNINLEGISLDCDCSSSWIIRFRRPQLFNPPTCKNKSKLITQLNMKEFCNEIDF